MSHLFSGQGSVHIANVVGGVKTSADRFVGTVPNFEVSFEADIIEHRESVSGNRLLDSRLLRGNSANVSIQIDEMTRPKNLADALLGANSTVATDSVTDEAFPDGLVDGDFVHTQNPKISSVVIQDSAGTPATLTVDVNYRIADATQGKIEFLDVAGFTQPFTADYTYAEFANVNFLSQGIVERWITFDGINTVPGATHAKVRAEIYKVALDPAQALSLIGEDFGNFTIAGSALYDSTKVADATLGQFGRIILL